MSYIKLFEEYKYWNVNNTEQDPDEPFFNKPKNRYLDSKREERRKGRLIKKENNLKEWFGISQDELKTYLNQIISGNYQTYISNDIPVLSIFDGYYYIYKYSNDYLILQYPDIDGKNT